MRIIKEPSIREQLEEMATEWDNLSDETKRLMVEFLLSGDTSVFQEDTD